MNLKLTKIKKIERIPFKGYLYDITSHPHHNFIANNVLVHNSEGTLGRRIQKGWKEIQMKAENGKPFILNLQAEVQTVEGLSGHSDRNQLLNFIHRLPKRPDKVISCHGEEQKIIDMVRTVHKLFRIETIAPRNLEAIRLK